MPRIARIAPPGFAYHVLNRANGKTRIFRTDKDFLAFERAIIPAHDRHPIKLLGWCIMGNHWHFVAHPDDSAAQLSRFFGYLALLHATRWQVAHRAIGTGHVYQSRFKHFMIQADDHLLAVLRYVERNPLRAGLVKRAQDWRWSSLHVRENGPAELKRLLSAWPIDMPRDWVRLVNQPQTRKEEAAIEQAIQRGSPFGQTIWAQRVAKRYHLETTQRPRGRPKGWRKAE